MGEHLLEFAILTLQFFEPFDVGVFHATLFGFSVVVGGLRDAVFTAYVFYVAPSLRLPKDADNLCLFES